MRRGFLLGQKSVAKNNKTTQGNKLALNTVQTHTVQNHTVQINTERNHIEQNYTKQTHTEQNDEKTYFDLLPLNVKQILMQWIWYTQPKINWMGDGRDESIRLMRMLRLQRIANDILKIDNIRIYGEKKV